MRLGRRPEIIKELSLSLSVSVCLSVCLCLSVSFSVSVSLCLSVSVSLSLSLSLPRSVCLCVPVSLCVSVSLCLSACLPACLSVCLFVCLSLPLSLSLLDPVLRSDDPNFKPFIFIRGAWCSAFVSIPRHKPRMLTKSNPCRVRILVKHSHRISVYYIVGGGMEMERGDGRWGGGWGWG